MHAKLLKCHGRVDWWGKAHFLCCNCEGEQWIKYANKFALPAIPNHQFILQYSLTRYATSTARLRRPIPIVARSRLHYWLAYAMSCAIKSSAARGLRSYAYARNYA